MPAIASDADSKQEQKGSGVGSVASILPPVYSFKSKDFKHANITLDGKRKPWKPLKQILAQEQGLEWPEGAVSYSSLDAPTSFKPAKKYADLSGLEAPYTDPQTKLHYASGEEFTEIRRLQSDIIQGYLSLRKANNLIP